MLLEHSSIAVVHRRGVHAAERFARGWTAASGFVSACALLAEAASTGISVLPLPLSLAVRLAMALAVWLALTLTTLALRLSLLLVWLVRSRSATSTPPSASFPSGAAGRRIRSLIHVALLVTFVYPQVAGSHIREPLLPSVCSDPGPRISASLRLKSSLKSNQLRPSGAWNP